MPRVPVPQALRRRCSVFATNCTSRVLADSIAQCGFDDLASRERRAEALLELESPQLVKAACVIACLPVAWHIYFLKPTPNGAWRVVGEALQNTALVGTVRYGRKFH